MASSHAKWAGPNLYSPIRTEPLVGSLRHFVGRETATFYTVRKYKEVSVLFNIFTKKYLIFFWEKSRKEIQTLELQTVPQY